MIAKYERMLQEGAGITVSQEGWGGAFNATTTKDDDNSSLIDSITQYAERATAAESEVSALKKEGSYQNRPTPTRKSTSPI